MHRLYANVEEMLAPRTLAHLIDRDVTSVESHSLGIETSRSGSEFLAITTDDRQGPSFMLKRLSLEKDWIMRATKDTNCRSVALWQHGLLDRLRPEMDHVIVACAHDGDGWAILMRDISHALIDTDDKPVGHLEDKVLFPLLDGLAKLHATFWNSPELDRPEIGLCSPYDYYLTFSPQTARRNLDSPSPAPGRILEGQARLREYLDAEMVGLLNELWLDPEPFLAAIARYPQTLAHGDWQANNLALSSEGKTGTIALDWQLATAAPATIDLFWLLNDRVPEAKVADRYLSSLSAGLGYRLPDEQWYDLLALGALSKLLRAGVFFAYFAQHGGSEELSNRMRSRLDSLSTIARPAVRWLS